MVAAAFQDKSFSPTRLLSSYDGQPQIVLSKHEPRTTLSLAEQRHHGAGDFFAERNDYKALSELQAECPSQLASLPTAGDDWLRCRGKWLGEGQQERSWDKKGGVRARGHLGMLQGQRLCGPRLREGPDVLSKGVQSSQCPVRVTGEGLEVPGVGVGYPHAPTFC